MDQQEASHSQRRLKRMRSDAPLRDSFNDPQNLTSNDLDSDLQDSIRSQDAASKRARLSGSVNDAGSPIRRSRFVEGTMKDTASNPPPGDFLMSDTRAARRSNVDDPAESAPSSGFSAAFRNALTPVWSGMSGMFGRRSTRDMPASAVSTNPSVDLSFAGPSMNNRLTDHEPLRTHSSQSNVSSAKDSGVYVFNGGSSSERKPFASPDTNPMNNLRGALNLSPTVPNGATFSPHPGNDDISPFKRLHRASVSSLRKVRSHFALSGLRRSAIEPDEHPTAEPMPAVPAIPDQFVRANPTKDELKKRQKLEKKMSSLQSQLEQCKEEYAETFGPPGIVIDSRDFPMSDVGKTKPKTTETPARRVSGENKLEKQSWRLSMERKPEQQTSGLNADSARPLASVPIYMQRKTTEKALQASIEPGDFSPSENGKLTALPQMPPSPPKQQPEVQASTSAALMSSPTSPALPIIEPGSILEHNNAAYREAAEVNMSWDFERNRRSLSTIMSSRAASPEPLAEIKASDSMPTTRDSLKPSSLSKRASQQSAISEEDASKQENVRHSSNSAAAGTSTPPRSGSSRIPRHSPRKSRNDASDLPIINAVRSSPRSAGRVGSPRKRSETDGVRKRRPRQKKSLVGSELGQFNATGEWEWGEETF